jgi:hypothetical protein
MGYEHELLDVDVVVRVGAAVQDVHHGDGERAGPGPSQIAIEGNAKSVRGCPRNRHRYREDCVRAEPPLVLGTVRLDKRVVDPPLIRGFFANQVLAQNFVDVLNGLGHSLAEVPADVAVAKLDRLVFTGRGPRGDRGPAMGPAGRDHLGLQRGISPTVQDLSRVDDFYHAHVLILSPSFRFCNRRPRRFFWLITLVVIKLKSGPRNPFWAIVGPVDRAPCVP